MKVWQLKPLVVRPSSGESENYQHGVDLVAWILLHLDGLCDCREMTMGLGESCRAGKHVGARCGNLVGERVGGIPRALDEESACVLRKRRVGIGLRSGSFERNANGFIARRREPLVETNMQGSL